MTLALWLIDLGQPYNDAIRVAIVAGFAVLAIALPPVLEARARAGRRRGAHELGVLLWLIFAAGIAAVLVRWGQALVGITTLLRLAAVIVGAHYLWANRRAFRRR